MLFVLFEHAVGYSLFEVTEFEEIGTFLPQDSVTDFKRFSKIIKLLSFHAFGSALDALESINSISEGIAPDGLRKFLEMAFCKKRTNTLGVFDKNLAANITETLGIKCTHKGVVPEIVRGIRYHFHRLVKGVDESTWGVAQLGLGHSYSRAKIKFNVHRADNNIIQSIAIVDLLEIDINKFSMRIREWYSYNFPELYSLVPNNYLFAKVVQFIGNRRELSEEKLEGLEALVMDSGKARAILDAARSSMGMDIAPIDLENLLSFTNRVIALIECRNSILQYLKDGMATVAPNLSALLGEQIGARLISHAGSLTKLAKCPASTVQILGAEKALFRALKTRSHTPKYGILFNTSFIGRASVSNRGKISRFLANKSSIAARLDCFAESNAKIYGQKLKMQVEDRLSFLESGTLPPKNIDVRKEATPVFNEHQRKAFLDEGTSGKKKKKRSHVELETEENVLTNTSESSKKKKKKKSHVESEMGTGEVTVVHEDVAECTPKKKKNSIAADETENGFASVADETPVDETKKKKKKKKHQ